MAGYSRSRRDTKIHSVPKSSWFSVMAVGVYSVQRKSLLTQRHTDTNWGSQRATKQAKGFTLRSLVQTLDSVGLMECDWRMTELLPSLDRHRPMISSISSTKTSEECRNRQNYTTRWMSTRYVETLLPLSCMVTPYGRTGWLRTLCLCKAEVPRSRMDFLTGPRATNLTSHTGSVSVWKARSVLL